MLKKQEKIMVAVAMFAEPSNIPKFEIDPEIIKLGKTIKNLIQTEKIKTFQFNEDGSLKVI